LIFYFDLKILRHLPTRMPLVDYSKTIIYQIKCLDDVDFCYVGHTTNFRSRKNEHKSCSSKHNSPFYVKIRELGGWEKFEMIPLEEYTICKSLMEARIREQEWIEKIQAKLNSKKAYQSLSDSERSKIHRQKNPEKVKAYNEQYRQEHKEELKEKSAQYRIENYDKHLTAVKNYIAKNPEKVKKSKAEWYAKNADKIRQQKREKYALQKQNKV